ncbi:MAG: hypothetical protein HYZ91_04200, partial [Candidatus Omnitrophica bacterium]|nr:hypothetical protein [Candidatus Omnitrophota bacterium]
MARKKRILQPLVMALILTSCLTAQPEAATQGAVSLTIKSLSATTQTDAPVFTGIPFPPGLLQDERQLDLRINTLPMPRQIQVLSRYPDGSLRVVLIGFRVTLAAGQTLTAEVRYGADAGVSLTPEMSWTRNLNVLALLPARWYGDSTVFGLRFLASQDNTLLPAFETELRKQFTVTSDPPRDLNPDNRNYYDHAHALYMTLLRSGGPDSTLQRIREEVVQYRENEILHAGPYRGQYSAGVNATNTSPMQVATIRRMFIQGLLEDYYVSGDARSLAVATEMGEALLADAYLQSDRFTSTERTGGFMLMELCAMYEATLNPRYLEAARSVATVVMNHQDAMAVKYPNQGGVSGQTGGFIQDLNGRWADPEESTVSGAGSPFMSTLLASGLMRLYWLTGDARLYNSLLRVCDWLADAAFASAADSRNPEHADTFWYIATDPAVTITTPSLNPMFLQMLGFAHQATSDAKYLSIAKRILAVNDWGNHIKEFNQGLLNSGQGLYLLQGSPGAAQLTLAAVSQPTPPPSTAPTASSPTGRNPKLFWTPARQAVWNRMKAENHPWWQSLKRSADASGTSSPRYGDFGGWATMAYQITGDPIYAAKAWAQWSPQLGWLPSSSDNTRERFIDFVWQYDWLYPALSNAQRTLALNTLNLWADAVLNITAVSGFDTRLEDSDEATAHYFGVALLALATAGENPRAAVYLANPFFGGLDATSSNRTNLRNTVKDYALKADGGVWLESSQYNLGTLQHFIRGIEGVRTATGVDHFPEAAALIRQFALAQVQEVTADVGQAYQWGDIEEMRGFRILRRVPLLGALAGLTQNDPAVGPYLHAFTEKMSHLDPSVDWNHDGPRPDWRFFLFYNPYASSADWRGALPNGHYAAGQGLMFFHDGWGPTDAFFGAHMPAQLGVDHEVKFLGNFQLYRKGQWVITNTLGYEANDAIANNSMMLAGLSAMNQGRGPVAQEFGPGGSYAYLVGATGGGYYWNGYWDPPPIFVHEWTRSLLYLPSTDKQSSVIIVFDRVNATPPTRLDRYTPAHQSAIQNAPSVKQWILHTPVAPTLTSGEIAWDTSNGQHVRVATLLPTQQQKQLYDERQLWMGNYVTDAEKKFQVRLWPSTQRQWDTFLNVIKVYDTTASQTTLVRSEAGTAEGVLLARAGQADAMALFNATQSPNLTVAPDVNVNSQLKTVRLLATGYRVGWTAGATSTDLYLCDLDPSKGWEILVDGGVPSTLAVSRQGIGRLSVSGAGAHTLEVRPNGTVVEPPPNPSPTPTPELAPAPGPTPTPTPAGYTVPVTLEAEAMATKTAGGLDAGSWELWSNGYVEDTVQFPSDGSYQFDVGARGSYAGGGWPLMEVRIDQQLLAKVEVNDKNWQTYVLTGSVTAGAHQVAIAFTNDYYNAPEDRNLYVDKITIAAPDAMNQPPVLAPIPPQSVPEGQPLVVAVTASDPDGDPLIYDVLDPPMGARLKEETLAWTPTFSQAGTYPVTFTASDGSLTDMESTTITVTEANVPPVVSAGLDQTITLPASALLNGTVKDDSLPKGTLTTTWAKVSGPGMVTFAPVTPLSVKAAFSVSGTYVLRLTASDGELSASDDMAVAVAPAPTLKTVPVTLEAETMLTKTTGGIMTGGWNLWANGYVEDLVQFPNAGDYEFDVVANGTFGGGDWPRLEIRIDGQPVASTPANTTTWRTFPVRAVVPAGVHRVAIAFTNDYWRSPSDDRNLYVDKV